MPALATAAAICAALCALLSLLGARDQAHTGEEHARRARDAERELQRLRQEQQRHNQLEQQLLQAKQDAVIINLGHKAVEGAAKAVSKVENEILDLEDARVEAGSDYIEAVNALKAKYKALEQALTDAHAAKVDALDSALAEAALKVLTAEDQYEAVVAQVRDELGVDVDG